MKKKVWIVSWYGLQAGGLERIVQIISNILKEEYQVIIVDIPYLQTHAGWNKITERSNRLILMAFFSLFVRRAADLEDIIITHGQNAPFLKSDFLFDHGSIMSIKRVLGQFIYGGSSLFELIAVRMAKMNVAVSKWTKEQMILNYHVNRERITVLDNCVETDTFYPMKRDDGTHIILLYCGRLEAAKGLARLCRIADIVEHSNEFELRIAANDDKQAELFQNRRNIRIKCGIPVREMNAFYNQGNVLLMPSLCEGFGMGIVESLAAGIPVVANRVGVMNDLIMDGCPAVMVIKPEESEESVLNKAKKISMVYSDFAKRSEVHEYMKKKYGTEQYRKRLLKLIRGEKNGESQHRNTDL